MSEAATLPARGRRGAWALAVAVSMAALLAPALANGFPLVFADTGGYLERAFLGTLDIGRSALYGAFLAAGVLLFFWPNMVIQAALIVWILALTLRAHGLGDRPLLLAAVVIALCLTTSLPWFAGQLMPDIFLPLAVLALYLLAFHRAALTRGERGGLVVFVGLAIASHMTVLALSLALLLVFLLLRPFAQRLRLPRPGLALPAAGLAAGLLLAPLSNLAITGQFAFTPGGTSFLFGRLLQDGIVARYLKDRCPDETLRLCQYRDELPPTADGWLWGYGSPLHKLGWWRAFEPEAGRIIRESTLLYPGMHLATAMSAALEQFVRTKTGEGMHARDNWHAEGVLSQFAPHTVARFRASLQQQNRFTFTIVNLIQVPLALLAAAALAAMLAMRRLLGMIDAPAAALCATVLLALAANAAICGVFSNPNDRYQSRIIWLAPFAAGLVGVSVADRARRRPARPNVPTA